MQPTEHPGHRRPAGGKEELVGLVYNPRRHRALCAASWKKCTYCVQRIEEVRIHAKVDGRRDIKEGRSQKRPASQTCPADAIAFGNINDPESKVFEIGRSRTATTRCWPRLNIRPRTTYPRKAAQSPIRS